MSVFVDTSGIIALMDRGQPLCPTATRTWEALVDAETQLLTSNYVIVETMALLQRRLGVEAVQEFLMRIHPLLEVVWVNEGLHEAGVGNVLAARRRDLGLVDCISFEIMRAHGITRAFAYDKHFDERNSSLPPDADAE